MSDQPRASSGDGDPTPEARPRPTWGQPAPSEPVTSPTPGGSVGPDSGAGRPPYSPAYGQPAAPYGNVPYGEQQPAPGPQQSWPQQDWGQQASGQQDRGQQDRGQQDWGQPSAAQYGQDLGRHEQAYAQMYGEKPRQGMAIAALVLGILAALVAIFPIGSYVAVLMGLLAVIFGILGARRRSGKGMAVAGLILGGLGLVVAILASIFWTRLGIDAVEIITQCTEETGRSSGPAFDRCYNEKARDISPFG